MEAPTRVRSFSALTACIEEKAELGIAMIPPPPGESEENLHSVGMFWFYEPTFEQSKKLKKNSLRIRTF